MRERIVVGISGESAGTAALDWALDYAKPLKLEIELVHVVDDSWGVIPVDFMGQAVLEAEQELRAVADRAGQRVPDVVIHTHAIFGSIATELASRASSAELLVIGTHSRGRFGDRVFSRTSAQIAARVTTSVVIVPDRGDPVGEGVVVGIDGSEASLAAVHFAARLADKHRETLTAIYSWNTPTPWPATTELTAWPAMPADADRLVLDEALAGLSSKYPDLEIDQEIATGAPADALATASVGARLLVVGSHGRHGVARFWLGSVSHELALAMPCPVAIIRTESSHTAL